MKDSNNKNVVLGNNVEVGENNSAPVAGGDIDVHNEYYEIQINNQSCMARMTVNVLFAKTMVGAIFLILNMLLLNFLESQGIPQSSIIRSMFMFSACCLIVFVAITGVSHYVAEKTLKQLT